MENTKSEQAEKANNIPGCLLYSILKDVRMICLGIYLLGAHKSFQPFARNISAILLITSSYVTCIV